MDQLTELFTKMYANFSLAELKKVQREYSLKQVTNPSRVNQAIKALVEQLIRDKGGLVA